ncbi:MAG: hypothetical protein GF320_09335 [Armatimonadia bacterium]|nr:hypothetical protein [Armatimonadia bacterium]
MRAIGLLMLAVWVAAYPSATDPVPVDGYEGDLWFSAELAETRTVPFQPILLRLTVTNRGEAPAEVVAPLIGEGWPVVIERRAPLADDWVPAAPLLRPRHAWWTRDSIGRAVPSWGLVVIPAGGKMTGVVELAAPPRTGDPQGHEVRLRVRDDLTREPAGAQWPGDALVPLHNVRVTDAERRADVLAAMALERHIPDREEGQYVSNTPDWVALQEVAKDYPSSAIGLRRAAFDCLATLAYETDVEDPESTAAAVARAEEVIGDCFLADHIPSALAEARYRQAGRRGWKAQLRWVVHYGDRNSAAHDPKKAREAMNEAERLHQQAAAEWIRRQDEIGDFERLAWARYQISLEELTLERARGLYVDGD